jgi:LPXTG-motif cell wall-anchored protein
MEPAMLIALVGVGLLLAAGSLWLVRRRAKSDPLCHYRCPRCGQKLRYHRSRSGKPAACTRCFFEFVLPATPVALDSTLPDGHPRWGEPRRPVGSSLRSPR